jgi:hypothetical protein
MVHPSPLADPWVQLSELREKAREGDAARAVFNAGLRDFHEAGWTFRQLGKANGVSHEFVRLAILDAPEGTTSGIAAPPRPKSLSVIPLRDMDEQIVSDLKGRLAGAVEADPEPRTASGIKAAVADYFAALHQAAQAGWDAHSMAHAIGSHPKAIFKFVSHHERYCEGDAPAIPEAPHREEPTLWRARRPNVPLVLVPDEDVTELHALEQGAFGDTPTPAATKRYLALLGAWYLLGANRDELERASGQRWETIRKRLVRGGYMSGQPRSTKSRPTP